MLHYAMFPEVGAGGGGKYPPNTSSGAYSATQMGALDSPGLTLPKDLFSQKPIHRR